MDNMDYVDIFFTFLWTIWTLWTLRYSMDNSALDCESRCCGFTRKGHFATTTSHSCGIRPPRVRYLRLRLLQWTPAVSHPKPKSSEK